VWSALQLEAGFEVEGYGFEAGDWGFWKIWICIDKPKEVDMVRLRDGCVNSSKSYI
jgi:hypothetical protein